MYFFLFSFFCLVCEFFNYPEIINLTLGMLRHVDIVHITGYLLLFLISTVGYFLATFCCLIDCLSWVSYYFSYLNYAIYFRHVQKIKHYLCLDSLTLFRMPPPPTSFSPVTSTNEGISPQNSLILVSTVLTGVKFQVCT